MSFQDELKASYRTKEEALDESKAQIENEIYEEAKDTFRFIKICLLDEAKKGNSFVENGITKVSACWQIPPEFLHRREEIIEATYGKTLFGRKILLSSGGNQVIFSVNKTKRYEIFREYLCQMAALEDIEIDEPILVNDSTHQVFNFPYTHKGSYFFLDWKICVKCKVSMSEDNKTETVIIAAPMQMNNGDTDANADSNVINIDNMDGLYFEQFCAKLLLKNGFDSVEVTPGSGDQGIDIIAIKDGVKYGIQCKCYSSDIGNDAVQEAFSGKSFYHCHIGAVLTNRFFTRSAVALAESNNILLWDRKHLLKLISKAGMNFD